MKEKTIHNFINDLASQLKPSNDTMNAVRLLRKHLPSFVKAYADWKIKECLPKKMPGYFDVNDYEEGCTVGFNRCIDQILANKDKIK